MNELVGNESVIARAKALFETKPCNAIFVGNQGLGKCTVAKELTSGFPDVLLLDGNGFDTEACNELLVKLSIVLLSKKKRVVLIDNASSISDTVQNKLLKVVEDEQKHNVFLFIAHKPLLPTVMSRCVVFSFSPIDDEQVYTLLKEKESERLEYYCFVACGSVGSYYRVKENELLDRQLYAVYELFSSGQVSSLGLLRAFDLVDEKSTSFENLVPELELLLRFLTSLWEDLLLYAFGAKEKTFFSVVRTDIMEVYECLHESSELHKRGLFTKQEFIRLLQMMGDC